jgi:hypothetical protein
MTTKAFAVSRLVRAYATQVETPRRLRNGGSQRAEHVHVNEGGQAVVDAVAVVRRARSTLQPGRGDAQGSLSLPL